MTAHSSFINSVLAVFRSRTWQCAVGLLLFSTVHANEPVEWRLCSKELANESVIKLTPERRRHCVIAIASTYLLWVDGKLNAADIPLSDDFIRRVLGTPRNKATTDRVALLADTRPDLIASVTEHEWFVEADTAWAIFTVTLNSSPPSTHWVTERFVVSQGRISDIMALPPVQQH